MTIPGGSYLPDYSTLFFSCIVALFSRQGADTWKEWICTTVRFVHNNQTSTQHNNTRHVHTSRADAQLKCFRFRLRAPGLQDLSQAQYSRMTSGLLFQHEAVQQGKVVHAFSCFHDWGHVRGKLEECPPVAVGKKVVPTVRLFRHG